MKPLIYFIKNAWINTDDKFLRQGLYEYKPCVKLSSIRAYHNLLGKFI